MSARQVVASKAPLFGMLRARQARQALQAGAPTFVMLQARLSEVVE